MIEHERGTQADCEDIILPYYLQINVSRVKKRNAGRSEENHNPEDENHLFCKFWRGLTFLN